MKGSISSLTPEEFQHFTATGRPYKDTSAENSYSSGMGAIMGADTFGVGNGPPNVLPFRYTDESLIMVPVLKTPFHSHSTSRNSISSSKMSSTFSTSLTIPNNDGDEGSNNKYGSDVTDEKTRKESKSRKFSLGNIRRRSKSRDNKDDFEMKEMKRGEYLKHYAKDDDGKYIGTEEPADDCILRHAEDIKLYRS